MRNHKSLAQRPATLAAMSMFLAVSLLAAAPASRADDVGTDLAPAGQSIKKAAQDTGTAIDNTANDVGQTVEKKTAPAVASVKQGAQETGNFFERSAKQVHDGAQDFFTKVDDFFGGR